ncbi:MAG: efflux RND transporter permease subunit [Clostridium sp.]|nr:efflux RND transporter permease subunit [Clostridium sp.]
MKKISNWIVERKSVVFVITVILTIAAVFGIFQTNVNYDMSKYLPKDSSVKKGMELMTDEYGEMSGITVMFDNLTEEEQSNRKTELEAIENVKSVVYLQDDDAYQKDNHSKYMINVSANTYSDEARDVLDEIRSKYGDEVYCSGAVVDNDMMVNTLMEEIPVIAVIAVIIIFVILFLLCDSWIEPLLYVGCIGIAILLNMGSNVFLPSVSFMTFAIGALLQMGLSMDYSIMLMNRYNQEKQKNPDPKVAMKSALANAFGAITSSSVTTIVGLLVLLFMSFKIGQDMGIVLAKGVFISLICIFTILPGLVVQFDKAMTKTHKKSLNVNMRPVMKIAGKIRLVSVPLIAVIAAGAYFMKDNLNVTYIKTFDNPEQTAIEEVFGKDNQTVLLYENNESPENIEKFISAIEERKDVNYVQDYSNTIGKSYKYKELAEDMDMKEDQAKIMYQMYKDKQNQSEYEKISMYDLICYIDDNIAKDPSYAEFMSKEQTEQISEARAELESGKNQLEEAELQISESEDQLISGEQQLSEVKEQMKAAGMTDEMISAQLGEQEAEIENGKKQLEEAKNQLSESKMIYENKLNADELSEIMDRDIEDINNMLMIYRMSKLNVENDTLTLDEFLNFVTNEIMPDETYSAAINEDMRTQIADGEKQINENRELMLGKKYNRMIISINYPSEGTDTFSCIDSIAKLSDERFENNAYIVGDSAMGYEMDKGFADEQNFVTILTIIAILVVVLITFRSFVSSAVLVAVIQAAVFITTAIVCLQGYDVNYIALILVQCILMGATIDYGILLFDNYREKRLTLEKKEALGEAMNCSIKTILTSSLILIGICLTVSILMTQKVISQTCMMIAYGTICSVILVIFILPAILLLTDRIIIKNKKGKV